MFRGVHSGEQAATPPPVGNVPQTAMSTATPSARARRAAPFVPALLLLAGSSSAAPDSTAAHATSETLFYSTRDEIPREDRWDLTAIFPDRAAWDAARAGIEADLPALASFRGRLAESPRVLADALATSFAISRRLEGVYVYALQSLHTQTGDPAAQELSNTAQALATRVQEAAAFVDPEIVRIPAHHIARFREDPALAPWLHYLDNVTRTREHILSPEVEEILAGSSLSGAQFQEAYSSLQDSDIEWPTVEKDGERVEVVPGQYLRFVTDPDRTVRRDASLALFGTYDRFANTFAATLRGSVQRDTWLARTRGYETGLDMALDAANVPRSVVETLVRTVHDDIAQVRGYAELRKRLLGLDELHVYDLYVNLLPGLEKTYTFDEGWTLATAFWKETFGPEYVAVAEQARRERWIDVYTNKGKQPGAYAWGTYDSHPYLFLNWSGRLDSVSTLVHEMGHAIHKHLASREQPYQYSDYSTFVAEVASVASESLFLEWMVERSTDPAERKLLLNQAMDNITGTFVRQVFFHEWEAAAHAMAESGRPLTRESLGRSYASLWQEYYGPDLVVDDVYSAGWARVSHFYRSFYVWSYATSFAAGEALAQRFRDGDKTAVADYLAMLRLGGAVYPMDALRRAGVDMNDPKIIGAVMDRYGELQKRLETEMRPSS
jgi:oligoendopeptidase F